MRLSEVIAFCNAANGIQCQGHLPNQYNDNYIVTGFVGFNNGVINGTGSPIDLLIGSGDRPSTGVLVRNCRTFRNDTKLTADLGYYFAYANGIQNQDLACVDNYFVGGVELDAWASAVFSRNVVYSTQGLNVLISGMIQVTGPSVNYIISPDNTYYGDPTAVQWGYNTVGYNFANWKAITGFTNPGSYGGTSPNGIVYEVRPNFYEAGRANIIIYNWANQSSVAVDLGNTLQVGQAYYIVNAQDFYGAPVLSGVYLGGTVNIPMAGIASPTPLGRGIPGPTTGPTFQVFVVRLQGA
jgi:hypothetical protein